MSFSAANRQDPAFESWLERQLSHSASAMLSSISPVSIVKHREGFGQTVRPVAGAIVASPVLGNYDPDPDYFFHWFRDSAVVIDALRLLHADRRIGDEALRHLRDFTRFSLALNGLDGRAIAAVQGRRERVASELLQYLREDGDLASVHGDAVAAETRVNPDGTLDILRWARPQHDGPPLRALALLRWVAGGRLDAALLAEIAPLIRFDLDFTLRHWREPSFDIWEEESGHHYYTLRVSAAALAEGAAWLAGQGETAQAQRCREESQAVLRLLDGYWVDEQDDDRDPARGYYRSRELSDGQPGPKALDIAVILSAIHSLGTESVHGPFDPRMQATLARLDALFDAAYPINHSRAAGRGTAMGRYAGDVYCSGGAYYFSTLGAAEFCFRAAAAEGGEAHRSSQWMERGDAYLATVRAYTPDSGDLSEQFDQRSGAQTSAKQLAWSHAAFISCVSARRIAASASQASRRR
ncbi:MULTISPECIES: glycoside hydrolase family 15 protein [unclassified Variovorax]|uniref:glycoside hydrolase family 15 protein n=1 Tax=unclassified Variovorax TaxID=663243 RepID=UPI000F7ED205|nr:MULTISPECIES: glycoside hydrolase family 15 protein [unclassified Variovorax]RSZ46184.1 glucan 1,4-alpha-glucosidase [Variovorax sp. 553]RSZ46361.1 glucan 1,4-alpha-glucosidase [Variovorax sp. 679]